MAPGRLSMFRNSASISAWFLPGNGSLVDVTMGNTPRSTVGYTKKRKYKGQRDLQEQNKTPYPQGNCPSCASKLPQLKREAGERLIVFSRLSAPTTGATVIGLFLRCSPSAVGWLIIPVIVGSVYRFSLRALAHVLKKILK